MSLTHPVEKTTRWCRRRRYPAGGRVTLAWPETVTPAGSTGLCDHATESGPNQGLLGQRWYGPTVNELSDSAPWLRGKVRRDLGRTSPWHGPASRRSFRPRKSVRGDIGSATRRGCTFDYETRIRTTAKSGSTGDPRTSRPRRDLVVQDHSHDPGRNYTWNRKRTGQACIVRMAHVLTIRGGKVLTFQQHIDTARVRELSY